MMWSSHCDTEQQARQLWADLVERLGSLGLELHPDKTKIVYCKDTNRRDEAQHTSFDFLGYTFRGRLARGRRGFFVSFSPAMSPKAKKAIGEQIRDWHLNRRSATDLAGLARAINARIRGWFNYYGAFYRSELYAIAARIDEHLVRWAMQKFKRLRGQPTKAWRWLDAARQREPQLFAHWHLPRFNPTPDCGEPYDGRLSRTVLREREGEVPSRHSPGFFRCAGMGGHRGVGHGRAVVGHDHQRCDLLEVVGQSAGSKVSSGMTTSQ